VIVCRLLELISSDTVSIELKVESVVILGSLAKGPEHVVQCVFDSGLMPLLLKGVSALLSVLHQCMFAAYFFQCWFLSEGNLARKSTSEAIITAFIQSISGRKIEYWPVWLRLRWGMLTCMSDGSEPIWQMTPHGS